MLIAQISDLHITAENQKAYGVVSTNKHLEECIKHINQLSPKPDVVLVTGDITNKSKQEECVQAKSLLDKLEAPYFIIPGNHDQRDLIMSSFAENTRITDYQGFIQYVVDDYEIRLIGLDTQFEGQSGGQFCSNRAAWLDQQLASNPDQPTIIFMHHPPLKVGVLETDEDGFEGVEYLADVVKKHAHIKAILCGHIHLQTHTLWHGTVVSTAPSMGLQLLLDLTLEKPSQFYHDQPAYQLHSWTADQNLVSFAISTRDLGEPHLF